VYQFFQDLSFSFRSLRRSPGFTFIAVLTLSLGIAGIGIVFSFINAALIRPLPYPEPHRLTVMRWQGESDISAAAFFLLKNRMRSFSAVAALYPVNSGVNIAANGPPLYVRALPVSSDFFQTMGIRPRFGTSFPPDQNQSTAPRLAVLSYSLWTSEFNRDPAALDRHLMINGENYNIIGVMPPEFRSYPEADIWLPLHLEHAGADPGSNYRVIARLAPGTSLPQLQYELDALAREYHSIYPWSSSQGTLVAQDLQSFSAGKESHGLTLMLAAVALVFLIACTNVAILILVRATEKIQPLAIRAALGSTRQRLMFATFSEALLLSAVSGVLGLILTKEALPLFLFLWPADLPFRSRLGIDWRVVLLTFAVALLSSLLVGAVPGLKLSRVNLSQMLASRSHTASRSAEQVRTIRQLVFGQVVLTVMLLAGTMLLVRSLMHLYSVPLGFDPDNVVVAQVALAGPRYSITGPTDRLISEIVQQARTLNGVESASAVNGLPLENGLNLPVHPADMPGAVDYEDEFRPITSDYFPTLRILLREGRFFNLSDTAGSAPVAIINETMARRWWPNTSPIGHYVRVDEKLGPQPPEAPREVVGVVSDIHEKGLARPAPPTVFVPMSQVPDNITAFTNNAFLTSILIRTSGHVDPTRQIQSVIHSVSPDLPVASVRPFREVVRQSLAEPRFIVLLTTAFSGLALLLTAVGLQGLLNYQVHLRAREIAIRIAVGASRNHIIRMVVQQGTSVICFAIPIGICGAFVVKRLLGSLLYNLQSGSPATIIATGILLGSVVILISLLTAIRAASIDPTAVLRNE
jgi:predicted permease